MNSRSFFFTLLRVNGFMNKVMLPFALMALVMDILAILRKEFGARYNLLIRTAFSPDLKLFAEIGSVGRFFTFTCFQLILFVFLFSLAFFFMRFSFLISFDAFGLLFLLLPTWRRRASPAFAKDMRGLR